MFERYYKFSQFLKDRYGEKVWKISVDAGLTCPNRDGHVGKEGCIFCRVDSFSKMESLKNVNVSRQIERGIQVGREKYSIHKFIVYFQASTNTYAPVNILREYFFKALSFEEVVGISISTRPDCLQPDVLRLIDELARKRDVWVELGLQSVHNETLNKINRGHSFEDFRDAVITLKRLPVRVCVHLMFGLPGEGQQSVIKTAEKIGRMNLDEVKLHPLLILKDTTLEKMYLRGQYSALSLESYTSMVCDFLERTPEQVVIQRLTAEAPGDMLIEPRWALNKLAVLNAINNELQRRDTRQGQFFIISRIHNGF